MDNIPVTSAKIVQQLEELGGIVVGKTNQPEFASGSNTFNEVFGATKNPWGLTLTAGGSSGNEGRVRVGGASVWQRMPRVKILIPCRWKFRGISSRRRMACLGHRSRGYVHNFLKYLLKKF
jgi:hypothetical protein